MHPYKIILFVLAIFVTGYSLMGIKQGKIRVKDFTYEKQTQPTGFWISALTLLAFGVMLFYFAFFGKITK